MQFTSRGPARTAPPAARASRWADRRTAEAATTDVLRRCEGRLRRSAALREPWVELRGPAPAGSGTLLVQRDGGSVREEVTSAVVRMDLSGASPVVLAAFPEHLDDLDGAWDLLQVLSRTGDALAEHWWDPDDAAVAALHARVTGAVAGPPEGPSWSAWGQHLRRALADPPPATPGAVVREDPRPARTGELDADLDLPRAVAEVLDRHAAEVDAWRADAEGSRRLHVVADLGRVVGTVTTRGPELAVATRHLAVVLRRLPGAPDGAEVADASPELPLDETARARRPVAAALLGGYLGVGADRLDVTGWAGQRALLAAEPPAVLERFRADLDALAAVDDASRRAALAGLGAAVAPRDTGRWLRSLSRRLAAAGDGG